MYNIVIYNPNVNKKLQDSSFIMHNIIETDLVLL